MPSQFLITLIDIIRERNYFLLCMSVQCHVDKEEEEKKNYTLKELIKYTTESME